MNIGEFELGCGPCFVIAEAGVNHNGNVSLAKRMVNSACRVGANAVKFQTFSAEELVTRDAPKATYQISGTTNETQFEMLKRLELPVSALKELKELTESYRCTFLSTPFDYAAVDLLDDLGVCAFKVSSSDFNNLPMLQYIASKGKPMIVSSGMSNIQDVLETTKFLDALPCQYVLLHCTSAYPTPHNEANLRVITRLRSFNHWVGYSDHTTSLMSGSIAVALGAVVVEKHFTLSHSLPGPDQFMSLRPPQLLEYVANIRTTEVLLGHDVKDIMPSEFDVQRTSRKSIVASRPINKGSTITLGDLLFKRPGTGISPQHTNNVVGRTVLRDIGKDELLSWSDLV
jgi:N,N'-diacetyllegionaminate synthase